MMKLKLSEVQLNENHKYPCPECGDAFDTLTQLRGHWSAHAAKRAIAKRKSVGKRSYKKRQVKRKVATLQQKNGSSPLRQVNYCPVCGCNVRHVAVALNV